VLVGHGIGGLVIKSFLAHVDKVAMHSSSPGNCKAFQENLQGIVFYAVPHYGSSEDFEKYTKICNNVRTATFFFKDQLEDMSFLDFTDWMPQLDLDFTRSIKEDTMIMAIEGHPMGQEVQFHN